MRVPVTDAFDESDPTEPLTVDLTPAQIEWLEQEAESRGLSVDHMLRSILTAQMREEQQESAPPATAGDGVPLSSSRSDQNIPDEQDDENSNGHSIVESLRLANQQLQDLTDEETTANRNDTVSRLQARMDASAEWEPSMDEKTPESVLHHDQNRSMFDMVEDE